MGKTSSIWLLSVVLIASLSYLLGRHILPVAEYNMQNVKNVIVVGGSYVGWAAVDKLSAMLPATHRVLLIEPHSHFQHLFAFPRFAVVSGHEHKAFVPYTGIHSKCPSDHNHTVIQAKVLDVTLASVRIDRPWDQGGGSTVIPYDYLVLATGTKLPAPGAMSHDAKDESVRYFQAHQEAVKKAQKVAIIGGGAVGVQMATDIQELYPDKEVILVHSRDHIMPNFHAVFSDRIKARFAELGVRTVLGSRAIIPDDGFPLGPTIVTLANGQAIGCDLAILATGQKPNNQMLTTLASSASTPLIRATGFVAVRPTMQFAPEGMDHLFAVGDIADSGAHKAARPGGGQAEVATQNIISLIRGEKPEKTIEIGPAAIHMSLGITQNVIFRNPAAGETQPTFKERDDGKLDMGVDGVWERRGVVVSGPEEYYN